MGRNPSTTTALPIAAEHFRRTLGAYPTGVTVITAETPTGSVGMSVGTFTSISLDPPLVGFFPQLSSNTLPRILDAGHFCVNVLGAGHEELARRFAGPTELRFADPTLFEALPGAPRLREAQAWVECTVEDVHEIGDHALVTGLVQALDTAHGDRTPLIFHQGRYSTLSAD